MSHTIQFPATVLVDQSTNGVLTSLLISLFLYRLGHAAGARTHTRRPAFRMTVARERRGSIEFRISSAAEHYLFV